MIEKWRSTLAELGTWKRGGKRAVHKPLLLLYLLARAQQGKERSLSFEEARPVLTEALRLFGPPCKKYRPEYPFWYLRNDGIWTIPDSAALAREKGSSREPSPSLLIRRKAFGQVPLDSWNAVAEAPGEAAAIAKLILEEFWPSTYHQNISDFFAIDLTLDAASTLASLPNRRRDPNFRIEVLRLYQRRCAICGYDARLADSPFGLEAAHIKWFSHGGPDKPENGLALCSLHHVAFDQGAIGLNDECVVQVSQDVIGSNAVSDAILRYQGMRIAEPLMKDARPSQPFIRWHWSNVFRVPARGRD